MARALAVAHGDHHVCAAPVDRASPGSRRLERERGSQTGGADAATLVHSHHFLRSGTAAPPHSPRRHGLERDLHDAIDAAFDGDLALAKQIARRVHLDGMRRRRASSTAPAKPSVPRHLHPVDEDGASRGMVCTVQRATWLRARPRSSIGLAALHVIQGTHRRRERLLQELYSRDVVPQLELTVTERAQDARVWPEPMGLKKARTGFLVVAALVLQKAQLGRLLVAGRRDLRGGQRRRAVRRRPCGSGKSARTRARQRAQQSRPKAKIQARTPYIQSRPRVRAAGAAWRLVLRCAKVLLPRATARKSLRV